MKNKDCWFLTGVKNIKLFKYVRIYHNKKTGFLLTINAL